MPLPPRIQYIDPLAEAADKSFRRAVALGFSHVLLPPVWAPSPQGDRFAPASLDAPHPALGEAGRVPFLAKRASGAGLALLLDVQVNRLAAGMGTSLGEGLFHGPGPADLLDPRVHLDAGADRARPQDAQTAEALGGFWGRYFHAWAGQGVAGFRLLGLDGIEPAFMSAFLGAIRRSAPEAALFAWTPGMTREAMTALSGAGLAGVFPSLPWWDFSAPWFWEELAQLRPIAPLIMAPEAPGAAYLHAVGQDPAYVPALWRRAAGLAVALGQGWLSLAGSEMEAGTDLSDCVRALNGALARHKALASPGTPLFPAGTGGPVMAVLRSDAADIRVATHVAMALINTDAAARQQVDPALLRAPLGGRFGELEPVIGSVSGLDGTGVMTLDPSEIRLFTAAPQTVRPLATQLDAASAAAAAAAPRLGIEAMTPSVDGGSFPAKRIAGDTVRVEADVVFDGHEKIAAALRWRAPEGEWQETAMRPLGNDRWAAEFVLGCLGRHEFKILAWRDRFETFRDELGKKYAAGVKISLELQEGVGLLRALAAAAPKAERTRLEAALSELQKANGDQLREAMLSPDLARLAAAADTRPFLVESPAMPIEADRIGAVFASWYEVFPRSLSDDEHRHGTFADVERHLPHIRDMGFDVLYFPPIHPIGRVNRKGRNNSLSPAPDDPGSPYAIGNETGGHDAIHAELGTLDDFRHLIAAAHAHGLEIAIDFAVQCAPDHPWLREHPGWFDWRPDGTIRYAENPPKKYEDIVNVDFYAPDAVPGLWLELCRIVLFWASQGVRLFRVDNPHTKPFPFWEWMIREVRRQYPEALFLAEAFTRPKIMYRLGKIGFSQSYTYFTWRNTKRELQEYLTELADGPARDFYRPHFFVNTPDINPIFLQTSGRPGFLIRAALAATLSGLWGVYNGFELCEAQPVPGKEEYWDSEKYQLRRWDWQRSGNIIPEITALNRIRRENPALQTHLGVRFHSASNDLILCYEKATPDRSNVVLAAVSFDPFGTQEASFEVPLWEWGLRDDESMTVEDLLTGQILTWTGKMQRVTLTPQQPYALWRVVRT